MQISIFILIVCALLWCLHPRNPHMNRHRRRLEKNYYVKREMRWRNYRENKPYLPTTITEKRVWQMDEFEFEEWLCTLWLKSDLYEIRHTAFVKWAYEKQFEINPSPTGEEYDNVTYLPTKSTVPAHRA